MSWGRSPLGFDPQGFDPLGPNVPAGPTKFETVELVGLHLRVRGEVSLLKFNRLSDLLNHNRGFVRIKDAKLLRRNGEPTDLTISELMVNEDQITFVGQSAEEAATGRVGQAGAIDRPVMERSPKQLVIFTPGHTLSGTIYAFQETDIATFVDTPDPRYIAMTDVTARSLTDRRVISRYAVVMVNRTQMTAAAFLENAAGAAESSVALE